MSLLRLKETFGVRGDIHHAVLLIGDKENTTKSLLNFLIEELGVAIKGNPDFHHFEYDSFGIDDGRRLQGFAIQKPLGSRKVFIAAFSTMTREAQNALLKLFEEPKDKTYFFLVTDSAEAILPTLKSRLFVIDMGVGDSSNIYAKNAKRFVKSTEAERITELKELIETKDKQAIYQFLGAIEALLYEKMKEEKTKQNAILGLEELAKSKQYLFDRASSVKLLLEHVALTVPRM